MDLLTSQLTLAIKNVNQFKYFWKKNVSIKVDI